MASAQPEISWPNYTVFIKAVAQADPRFEWLARFFSHSQQGKSSEGQLDVLESSGDIIKDSACSLDDLGSPPPPGNTRIVVLSYTKAWSLDRELLDRVSFALNLSPYFLWQHLEYDGHRRESAFPHSLELPPDIRASPALSEIQSLEIGWTALFHMSGMIVSPQTSSRGSVVMVLLRTQGFQPEPLPSTKIRGPASTRPDDLIRTQQSDDPFLRYLRSMSPGAIEAANKSPHDFFCPWIAGIRGFTAGDLMKSERVLGPFAKTEDFDEEDLETVTSNVELNYSVTKANLVNLRNYISVHPTARTTAILNAVQDLENLHSTLEDNQKRAHVLMNRLVSTMALKESRRSIEQSTSTKHLTQLAFIFLPLSLSTSVFGMNSIELQNTRLWVFFVTAGVSLAISLLLWFLFGWVSKPVNTTNLVGIGVAGFVLLQFFCISPSHGMTMILFALSHRTHDTRRVLLHLGVWDILVWKRKPPIQSDVSLQRLIGGDSDWARFWYRKISAVESFTAISGWYERRFWQKKAPDELP